MGLEASKFCLPDSVLLPDIDTLSRASIKFRKSDDKTWESSDQSDSRSNSFMSMTEALVSNGKIDPHLSLSDNAINLLNSALSTNMEDSVRTAILYALGVLKSDSTHSSVPVGLHLLKNGQHAQAGGTQAARAGGSVMRWLSSSFSPFKQEGPRRKVGLRGVAGTIRFAVRLRDHSRSNLLQEGFVFDAPPEQRAAIDHALADADEWGWDVAELREASGGRPLQTLGWRLLHHWDVGLPPFPALPSFAVAAIVQQYSNRKGMTGESLATRRGAARRGA